MATSLRLLLIPLFSFTLVSASLGAGATPEPAAAPPTVPAHLLADLRGNHPDLQPEGSWSGNLLPTPTGVLVEGGKGADGKGGMAAAISPAVDLSLDAYVEVALGVGVKNEVPEVSIGFTDNHEVQYTARVRIDQLMPNQPVWLRVKRTDFHLNDWQGQHAGQAIDWTHIVSWHLQGDWATAAPFHVVFIALRAHS